MVKIRREAQQQWRGWSGKTAKQATPKRGQEWTVWLNWRECLFLKVVPHHSSSPSLSVSLLVLLSTGALTGAGRSRRAQVIGSDFFMAISILAAIMFITLLLTSITCRWRGWRMKRAGRVRRQFRGLKVEIKQSKFVTIMGFFLSDKVN